MRSNSSYRRPERGPDRDVSRTAFARRGRSPLALARGLPSAPAQARRAAPAGARLRPSAPGSPPIRLARGRCRPWRWTVTSGDARAERSARINGHRDGERAGRRPARLDRDMGLALGRLDLAAQSGRDGGAGEASHRGRPAVVHQRDDPSGHRRARRPARSIGPASRPSRRAGTGSSAACPAMRSAGRVPRPPGGSRRPRRPA